MNISKAKITKDNTLVASFKNENEDNVTIDGKNLIHKDLRAAFNELIPHLAFLCEQKEADGKAVPSMNCRRKSTLRLRSRVTLLAARMTMKVWSWLENVFLKVRRCLTL